MPDKVGEPCECLSKASALLAVDGYEFPFRDSIGYNWRTGKMVVSPWTVVAYKKTPTGRRSKVSPRTILLNYCPICRKKIPRDSKATEESVQAVVPGDSVAESLELEVSGGPTHEGNSSDSGVCNAGR